MGRCGADLTFLRPFFVFRFEVDYWIGGLVTGGLPLQLLATSGWTETASQPVGGAKNMTAFVARAKWWLDRYRHFGHVTEDGAITLHLDQQCCHVQGVCTATSTSFWTVSSACLSPAPPRNHTLYHGHPCRSVWLGPEIAL